MITISDISGRTVFEENTTLTEGLYTLDALQNAEKGMYLLHISVDNRVALSKIMES